MGRISSAKYVVKIIITIFIYYMYGRTDEDLKGPEYLGKHPEGIVPLSQIKGGK